jgi:hypothetical protein
VGTIKIRRNKGVKKYRKRLKLDVELENLFHANEYYAKIKEWLLIYLYNNNQKFCLKNAHFLTG